MEMENETQEIQTIDDAQNEVIRRNIDPDVYNALNLYDEKLGEDYEKEGYNPFKPGFKLTEEFALEVLESKEKGKNFPKEDFLESGAKKVTSSFKNTLAASEKLIEKLEQQMSNMSLNVSTVHQIQRAIIFLKNRNQLLKRNIKELKYRNANAIQMFADMYVLDKELSDLLKETYKEDVDLNAVLNQFMNVCKERGNEAIKKRRLEAQQKREKEERRRDFDHDHDHNNIMTAGENLLEEVLVMADQAAEFIENVIDPGHDHSDHHPFAHAHDHEHHGHDHMHDYTPEPDYTHDHEHDHEVSGGETDEADLDLTL